jgi:signal transduction histidine kinase
VLADRGEIEQIVLALVTNARDAMPGGGTLVLALGGIAAGEGGEGTPPRVWLRVTDEGAGFTDAALEHLFEPFFTTRERGRGLGLGLALARATMTRAGGDIRVHSDPGGGAMVTLSFPRAAVGAKPDALMPLRSTPASD